jgi:hypothetical protein
MLVREWNLTAEPLSTNDLRKLPPSGLGKSDIQIRALETPIETDDFSDVGAEVSGYVLVSAKNVGELRDKIWESIPDSNKS